MIALVVLGRHGGAAAEFLGARGVAQLGAAACARRSWIAWECPRPPGLTRGTRSRIVVSVHFEEAASPGMEAMRPAGARKSWRHNTGAARTYASVKREATQGFPLCMIKCNCNCNCNCKNSCIV